MLTHKEGDSKAIDTMSDSVDNMYTPKNKYTKGVDEDPGIEANVEQVPLGQEEAIKGPQDGTVQPGTNLFKQSLDYANIVLPTQDRPTAKHLNNEAQPRWDDDIQTVKNSEKQSKEAVKNAKQSLDDCIIYEMDSDVKVQVALALNVQIQGGNNWEVIAEKLDVPKKIIRSWVSRNETVPTFNPTKCIIEYLFQSKKKSTVRKLRETCSDYGRHDVVRVIDEYYEPNQ